MVTDGNWRQLMVTDGEDATGSNGSLAANHSLFGGRGEKLYLFRVFLMRIGKAWCGWRAVSKESV